MTSSQEYQKAILHQCKLLQNHAFHNENGANVILKGDATVGSITDIDGNFDLSVPSNATLQVSYIGYNTQDVPVGNKSFLNITLKEDKIGRAHV